MLVAEGIIQGATPIFLGDLPGRLEQLDADKHITVMCESGARATIGASILVRSGFDNVDVFLGSMGAWLDSGRNTVSTEQARDQ